MPVGKAVWQEAVAHPGAYHDWLILTLCRMTLSGGRGRQEDEGQKTRGVTAREEIY